jgi:hypothetical protein
MDEDQPQDDFAYHRELWEANVTNLFERKMITWNDSTSGSISRNRPLP